MACIYTDDDGPYVGILLEYDNRGLCALGKCRVKVNRCCRPLTLCMWQLYANPERSVQVHFGLDCHHQAGERWRTHPVQV